MRKVFLLAVTMAVVGAASGSLVAESQATPPPTPSGQSDEERKLIQGVADTLRAKQAAAAKSGAVPKNWKPARLPWGDPDLSGVYTNSDESGIPFERPAEFEGRRLEDVTGEELARIQATRRAAIVENAVRASAEPNPQLFWWETLNDKRDQSQQPFEYVCHEGNYGLRNILSAARAQDRAAQDKEKEAEK